MILDNCSVHHVPEVIEHFREAGVVVFFLPRYSPQPNRGAFQLCEVLP